MINTDTYYHINRIAEERKIAQKVLENRKAVVVYFELSGSYMAIEKQTSGKEYTPETADTVSEITWNCKQLFEEMGL